MITRRGALVAISALVGFFNGTPAASQQAKGLVLPLDGTDFIYIRYRGQERTVSPQEIIDALGTTTPPQQQFRRF